MGEKYERGIREIGISSTRQTNKKRAAMHLPSAYQSTGNHLALSWASSLVADLQQVSRFCLQSEYTKFSNIIKKYIPDLLKIVSVTKM